MNNSFLKNRKFQFTIRLFTALCFALLTAYQIFAAIKTDESRGGRIILIVLFTAITVASFFVLSRKPAIRTARSVILVTALFLIFVIKLVDLNYYFSRLDISYKPSILFFAKYVFEQIGVLVLVVEYLIARSKIKLGIRVKITTVLMIVAIVLYTLCLATECLLMFRYRLYIEINLKTMLLSRLCFYFGFVCSAICWRLPAPYKRKDAEEEEIYPEKDENEIDFVL